MLYDTSSLIFLSTLSLRRATYMGVTVLGIQHNFYPRSPCGERLVGAVVKLRCIPDFYPRSPCGERLNGGGLLSCFVNFYPRSPCGERLLLGSLTCPPHDFYPRSPCGERHLRVLDGSKSSIISIHALLAESDKLVRMLNGPHSKFLSTLSLRRATIRIISQAHGFCIFLSTLSLRRATNRFATDKECF